MSVNGVTVTNTYDAAYVANQTATTKAAEENTSTANASDKKDDTVLSMRHLRMQAPRKLTHRTLIWLIR